MKLKINNELTNKKQLEYEESFWTGKKTITYDGVILSKIKHNIYEYSKGEVKEQVKIKGNQLIGITLDMFDNEIEILRKLTWYEYLMAIIVFIPCILFGLIGGVIGGIFGFTNLVIIRQLDKLYLKIIISTQFLLIGILLSYIVVCLILKIVLPFM